MMKQMKKIEVVVEQIQVPKIIGLLAQLNIKGYTLIKNVMGSGEHGVQDAQELSDIMRNAYLIIVTTEEKMNAFIHQVQPLLKKLEGIVMVSDVQWVKR